MYHALVTMETGFTSSNPDIRDLKHRRRGRQPERQKTIVLINKTLAVHVH